MIQTVKYTYRFLKDSLRFNFKLNLATGDFSFSWNTVIVSKLESLFWKQVLIVLSLHTCALGQGLLQHGPITELIFWKSYLETKSSKVLVISFEHLQKLCIFAKFGRHSSKIEPATPISISKCFGRKFKFECTKSLKILSKVVSYCDLQLVKIWCWYLKPLLIYSKITNFALTL